ncbi:MAG: M23 family metallopeptidase, partial [Anaerolineae bacterium]
HDLPLASTGNDNNDYVVHYDGSLHPPVTSTPIPGATPTPQGTPPPKSYIPGGFGYDQHGGIDYSLQYEPVLASASGTVQFAGWSSPANHRIGYGLYVVLDHTPGTNYDTWYGHFSALIVQTGDRIVVDPNDPGNRNRILGISGNTGSVFGLYGSCGSIPIAGPNCGQHLHFEVRISDQGYMPVDPYGWVAPVSTVDPWTLYTPAPSGPSGAISYDLWATRPAVESYTDQYPGGVPLTAPPVNNFLIEIDDSDPNFFSMVGSCWAYRSDTEGINGGYRKATVELVDVNVPPPPICQAEWTFDPTFTAPAGEYDVYVHVPAFASALHALYTIRHNGKTDEAIVVQRRTPIQFMAVGHTLAAMILV